MSFILPFINILNLGELALAVLVMIPLVLDAIVYTLVAYSVKVFKLMCTLNFNSIYGIIQPLVDRLQAVIIVFVAFLLGKQLIEYMLNPDSAGKKGATLLKNIFIATALFISYNFIFTVFNELNIALMGNEYGYKYTALSEVVDLNDEDMDKDKTGVITRFIFGKNAENMADPGETIAFNLLGSFIREKDSSNPAPSLKTYITTDRYGRKLSDGHYRFWNILRFDFARIITGDNPLGPLDYTFIISTIVGGFVVYSMFKASIQIGIRMFKLLILQMVAPIVIVDIIQNGFGGKFKTWSKRYIAVFLEALVRMLTMLIITVFVSQFILHIGDYFPKLESQQGFFTKLIIMIIVVIAAYMFAGEVPKFIDELIGTNLGESSKGNPLGRLLGMGIGAAAGFAGGFAAGGIGGAFAGMGKGLVTGGKAGNEGKRVADLFKAGREGITGGIKEGERRRKLRENWDKLTPYQRRFGAGIGFGIGERTGMNEMHNAGVESEKARMENAWKEKFKREHNGLGYDKFMEKMRKDNQELSYLDSAVEEECRGQTFKFGENEFAWNANDEDIALTDATYQQWATKAESLSDERKALFESGASEAELAIKDNEIAEANKEKAIAHQNALREIESIRNGVRDNTSAAHESGTTVEGRRQERFKNDHEMSEAQNSKFELDQDLSDLDKHKVNS